MSQTKTDWISINFPFVETTITTITTESYTASEYIENLYALFYCIGAKNMVEIKNEQQPHMHQL